jgi:uncharacterized protein YjiS (DUF1127 family)
MSICIEQNYHSNYQKNQKDNFSQGLSPCANEKTFSNLVPFKRIKYWMERSRQRKHLALLDDRLLKDIGYTREQAIKEVAKPFWK